MSSNIHLKLPLPL